MVKGKTTGVTAVATKHAPAAGFLDQDLLHPASPLANGLTAAALAARAAVGSEYELSLAMLCAPGEEALEPGSPGGNRLGPWIAT